MSERKIQLDVYSEEWPGLFNREVERITQVIGPLHVEHIGSTSVPGLSAKPVIDMMARVSRLDDANRYIKDLESLGYRYSPELEIAYTPDRKFFQRKQDTYPWYHLSFSEPTSKYWIEHIAFRDYLLKHPEVIKEYESLKKSLAEKYIDDFGQYNLGKVDFIKSTVKKALS